MFKEPDSNHNASENSSQHAHEQTESPLTNEHCEGREWKSPGLRVGKKLWFLIFSIYFLSFSFSTVLQVGFELPLSSGFPYYLWFPKLTKL